MGKGRLKLGGMSGGGNGGIAGSGVFGMVGTTIQCKSDDGSMYCNIMKLFNMLVLIIAFIFIMYMVYTLVSIYTKKRR